MSGLLMKISEAAEVSGLSAQTIRRLADSGKVKCVRPSVHRFVVRESLMAYLSSSEIKPEPKPQSIRDLNREFAQLQGARKS